MSDISSRRRLAGRALIGASLLALPLTATISYAGSINPPAAPAAPAAPQVPDAPQPPAPPPPPLPPSVEKIVVSGEFETVHDEINPKEDGSGEVRRVIVMRSKDGAAAAPGDRGGRRIMVFSGQAPANASGDPKHFTWTPEEDRISGEGLSDEERRQMRREVRESMAEMKRDLAEARKEMMIFRNEKGEFTRFAVDCKEDQKEAAWCHGEMMASTLAGLKQARAEIAANKDLQGDIRTEVLKSLDEAIAEWNSRS